MTSSCFYEFQNEIVSLEMPQIPVNAEVKTASFQKAEGYILDKYLDNYDFGGAGEVVPLFYECSEPVGALDPGEHKRSLCVLWS